jgi:hypothetical protein
MRRFVKNAVMVAALGALVGASITVAAPGGRDDGGDGTRENRFERRLDGPPRGGPVRGALLREVANKLSVSRRQLRAAMREAHEAVGPPGPPRDRSSGDFREQMEQHCTKLTDAVGKELGKSGGDVRSAFKSAALEGLDKAVERGRLSRERADRIRSRIESRSCVLLPPIGLRCGGPPGHQRGARPLPPPGVEPGAVPGPPPGEEWDAGPS